MTCFTQCQNHQIYEIFLHNDGAFELDGPENGQVYGPVPHEWTAHVGRGP